MTMGPYTSKTWVERNSKKTLFFLILFLTLFLDILGTGIYHLIKYGSIHKDHLDPVVGRPHPIFHHTLAPKIQAFPTEWGPIQYSMTTNSLGFKDRTARNVPLRSTKYRILFMGDSFTQGPGLEYDKTFVGLIDEKVSSEGSEILNGAAVSYSPAIYYLKTQYLLKNVGLWFNHLVVCLDISDIQDEAENYSIENGKVISQESLIKAWIYDYSMIPRNILHTSIKIKNWINQDPEFLRNDEDKYYGISLTRSLWTVNEEIYRRYGKIGLTRARAHMDQLKKLVADFGISMTLVIYPWPDQIFHKDLDSLQVQFWKGWAKQSGVKLVNLFPVFISLHEDPKRIISQYYIQGDVHWNDRGHRLVAEELTRELNFDYF